jgi:hypothetical protein
MAVGGQGHLLVVSLSILEDPSLEQELLAGVVGVEHVPLSAIAMGRVESAAAILLPSLAFLPQAAQRCLRPWKLLLYLGHCEGPHRVRRRRPDPVPRRPAPVPCRPAPVPRLPAAGSAAPPPALEAPALPWLP